MNMLRPGTRLGDYEITSLLGAGGMGEVYRGRDTDLGRDVAIKLLPSAFRADPERTARFRREAQMLASLNHPHIAAIYGLEQLDGSQFLVLELVDGDTLDLRLARGAIPFAEAMDIAKQIAQALEAAHDGGVIHRDLKPSNIALSRRGQVKVLDFGLAKCVDEDVSPIAAASQLPTALTPVHTQHGLILGTPAYMSPEQARGNKVDKRADIWAFGCVVFEMLTGDRPFRGETTSDVLAAVLQNEPDWDRLPADARATVEPLLKRCLKKEPVDRIRDIADARFLLEEGSADRFPTLGRVPMLRRRERAAWAAALAIAMIGALVAWKTPAEAPEVRLDITTPPTTNPESLAISPDGRTLAFVASLEGQSRLWLRQLDDSVARILPGTENAVYPFWSPDSRQIAFSVETDLKRIDLDTGAVQTVAPYISGLGGAWLPDDSLLVTPNPASPLMRVPATGGRATPVTAAVPRRFFGHRFPHLLPDGRHFLFFAGGEDGGIHVGSLTETKTRKILDATAAAYVPTGHLLFERQRTLFSQPFDVTRLAVTGNPTLIAQNIVTASLAGTSAVSVSSAGPIAYRTGNSATLRRLVWVDRSGKELDILSEIDQMAGQGVSLSADDKWVAWTQAPEDLWLFEVARRLSRPFTFEPTVDMHPLFSPDGRRLIYSANADGDFDLFIKPTVGPGDRGRLLRAAKFEAADDWSPDGKFVLYTTIERPEANLSPGEIWALPIDGTGKPFPVVRTANSQQCESGLRCVATSGQFSPSGTWIAFQSNESNKFEIYIQPFPQGNRVRISTGGGVQVRWGRDGREIFYIGSDNRLMQVSVDLASGKDPIVGVPVPLFTAHWSMNPRHPQIRNFSVAQDGRFLIDVLRETVSPVTVILNWKPKS